MAGEPAGASTGFQPTRRVPERGVPTWAAPDATLERGPRLEAGLGVELIEERTDGWTQVRCANGWTAWVDGRRLVGLDTPAAPLTLPPSGPPTLPLASPSPAAWTTAPSVAASVASDPLQAAGPLALMGAALVVVSSFLPWFAVSPVTASAWDIPVVSLLFRTASNGQPRVGWLLLLVVVVAVPLLTRRPLPRWMLLIVASVATNLALVALARVVRPQPHPDPGIGVFLAVVGGLLITAEFWRRRAGVRGLTR